MTPINKWALSIGVAALVRSHLNGLQPFESTIEQTTETNWNPSQTNNSALLRQGQFNYKGKCESCCTKHCECHPFQSILCCDPIGSLDTQRCFLQWIHSECAFRNHVLHSRFFQPGVSNFTVFNSVLPDQNVQGIGSEWESSTTFNRSPQKQRQPRENKR